MENNTLYFLPTDYFIWFEFIALLVMAILVYKNNHIKKLWLDLWAKPLSVIAIVILSFYFFIALCDSIHMTKNHHSTQVQSLLDEIIFPAGQNNEKTYSRPFATTSLNKETFFKEDGSQYQIYPALEYAGLKNTTHFKIIYTIILKSFFASVLFVLLFCSLKKWVVPKNIRFKLNISDKVLICTVCFLILISCFILSYIPYFHLLGTDKVGQDVLYETIKSIRTGLLIGILTTLVMLPFAIIFGLMAGYFGGWIDDIIQYIYTTMSSIPAVLLISASVLSFQILIENHPKWFPSLALRSDIRLVSLCFILGLTSWTGLCRLLRAETLKLRELDYVHAAKALGVSSFKIQYRHILPNLFHIILITTSLDFSGLVLAEAVLSYVGVGVDPSMISWGNMINSARLELARDPMIWWPLFAAFTFMFFFVLSANIFADALQQAFDPKKDS